MERNIFIFNLYSKFILQYLIVSFIPMYLVRFIVVNIQNIVKNGMFYNSFNQKIITKEIVEASNEKTYFFKYKKDNEIIKEEIFYDSYLLLKNNRKDKSRRFKGESKNGRKYFIKNNDIIDFYEKDNNIYKTISRKEELSKQEIKSNYINLVKEIYTDKIFMLFMLLGLIYFIRKKIKLHDFYLLPYDKNIFSTFTNKNETFKQYDYLKKQIKENGIIKNYYVNKSESNFDLYFKEKENIKQFLGLKENDFLDIERYGKKGVCIYPTALKKSILFNKNDLQKGKIYLGITKGNIKKYLDIKNLTHLIGVGETGSGKSVFENVFLTSVFYNKEMFEKVYLIDFKMVELTIYKKIANVELITTSKDLLEFIKKIHNVMIERLQEMEKLGIRTSKRKFIWIQTDEFGEIVNNTLSKEEKEEIKILLVDLLQKSRRTNMRFSFFGQKRDTENIYSNVLRNITTRICLGTENNDNITKIRGTKETLEKINLSIEDIKKFEKGRGVFKDGNNKDRFLFQSPFIDLDNNDEHRENWEEITGVKLPPKVENETNDKTDIEDLKDTKKVDIQIKKDAKKIDIEDLEEKRLQLWKKSEQMELLEAKEIRKRLFKVKQLLKNNDKENRKSIILDIEKDLSL